jgi:hypothetical protein
MKNTKSLISFLLLALLLIPMVQKAMHEIGHINDKHCEIQVLHFCETEHHCAICDYVMVSSDAPEPTFQFKSLETYSAYKFASHPNIVSVNFNCNLTLRGPPSHC